MKRIVSGIILFVCIALLCTGCIRMRTTFSVKNDGKIDFSMIYAVSDSVSEMAGGESSAPSPDDMGDVEAEFSQYSEDGYTGIVMSKKDIDPADFEKDFGEGLMGSEISFKQDGSTYILDIPWNSDDEDSNASSVAAAAAFITSQDGFAEIVVTLPTKPVDHNATSVSEDGKTLTWNLLAMGDRTSVHVEYTLPAAGAITGGDMTWLIIAGIVIGVIVLCVIIFFVVKSLKKQKNETPPAAAPAPAASPADKLASYKDMLDKNLITQEEYDAVKAEVLNIKPVAAETENTEQNQ